MTHQFKTTFLVYAAYSLIGFGLLSFLSLVTPVSHIMALFMDLTFWSQSTSAHGLASEAARLWIGISGGLMVGYGATLALVANGVYANNKVLGGRIIMVGIAGWFIFDGLGSIAAGAGMNAILNITFLAMFCGPILWPEKAAASHHPAI